MDGAQRFGRYQVTGTLGRGAMGQVYAALDDVLGRPVAIKTLHGGATGLGARILDQRFRLEARAIAALNHPGVVQVYDIDLTADPPYIVMERVAGPSLKERFAQGPLPPGELRALGIQIAHALAAAHAAGIVHRDVKPANILVAGPGVWKLADFGVAHVPDSSLTFTGQFVGSPAYSPPEALLRGQATAAGDVFGLGATLYYGAAGRWPRADESTRGLLTPVPSVRELAPQLPADLIATIDAALQIEPDRRPTAAELATALATTSPPGAQPTAALTSASPPGEQPAVETRFVPDASVDQRPRALAPAPVETAFVPDSTRGDRRRRGALARAALARWKWWAITGGVLAIIVVIAASSRGSKPAATAAPVAPSVPASAEAAVPASDAAEAAEAELDLPPPGQIRATTPPMHDRRAVEDWNKVVEQLYEHKFKQARDKLEKWERRWGESRETRSLRKQLESLPDELLSDE